MIILPYNIEPTDENVLTSLQNDVFRRNAVVRSFVSQLDDRESGCTVDLTADWGEGKTFFIKAAYMLISYDLQQQKIDAKEENEKLKVIASFPYLADFKMKHYTLPIYFDAWKYDQHTDPLLALVLAITKQCDSFIDTTHKVDYKKVCLRVLKEVGKFALKSIKPLKDVEDLIEGLADVAEEAVGEKLNSFISLAEETEEVRKRIEEMFSTILCNETQRMIIFIDELDRCRPTFAVELLERVKHYFGNKDVSFVFSLSSMTV